MRNHGLKGLILLIFLQSVTGAELKIGDNLETTLATLGKPVGTIELREKTLLLYPEGEVVLKKDAVVEIDLMSEDEFQKEQARLKREREEWLAEQARLKQARTEEGTSIRAAKRSSSAFASLPAKDRVDFWRSFQVRYPEVDVSEELALALEGYQTELAELKSQQQIAQLEARVAKAEQEAANARLETQRLKEETERSRQSTRYGLRYYYDPVVQPRYIYRPPTVTIFTNGEKKEVKHHKPDYWKFRHYNPDGTAERVARILHGEKSD
ncbi:hypothetical protein DDZ13_13535 [Coraliomargarita sinensis]|uniref:Uncharacterized protein n=1 Tax=Coraliomargarita sinensis TaxID=2174842 RepID=A0A317ZFF3_9BACT|nr:hypothetical protein [Coraliomargarita sinensis]PXA03087.1 hypothetical protein DDZ13_13535 [Coraliomargarita sinensis]